MKDKISIQKENVLNAYHQASEDQKALPENMFGNGEIGRASCRERV